jgi:hypothetical protein
VGRKAKQKNLREKMRICCLEIRFFTEHRCGGSHHCLHSFSEWGAGGLLETALKRFPGLFSFPSTQYNKAFHPAVSRSVCHS